MKTLHQSRPTPRDLQARRVRWQTGCSSSTARVIAGLAYGGVTHGR